MTDPSNVTLGRGRSKFGIDQDADRWYVVDLATPRRYRLALSWDNYDQAEAFMDRCNAIYEGEPMDVIEELRGDADRMRS